jgi:hypothetical protein
LHPAGEPLETLDRIRRAIGEYNFAGQYQQCPAPLGGGLVKAEWFKHYRADELPKRFDRIVQSWDTAKHNEPATQHPQRRQCENLLMSESDFKTIVAA